MFWIPMLAGAVIGGLSNKKNPLQGAIMGAGIGATGGAAAGGLLGGAAAGGAGAAGVGAGTGGAGATGLLGSMAPSAASSGTGLLGTLKPIGQFASLAQQSGMFGGGEGEQPIQAVPPMQQPGTGPQALAQIAQNDPAYQSAEEAMARRRRRRELLERVA